MVVLGIGMQELATMKLLFMVVCMYIGLFSNLSPVHSCMYVFFPFVSSGTVQGRATTSLRPGKRQGKCQIHTSTKS